MKRIAGRVGRRLQAGTIAAAALCLPASVHAAEHVTLKNGFEVDCVRREIPLDAPGRVRLYLVPTRGADGSDVRNAATNYIEVAADAVVRVEQWPDPVEIVPRQAGAQARSLVLAPSGVEAPKPTVEEMREMLTSAGAVHHIDADLLASVVKAESGGQVRAVSPVGARGLMQLMPATATELGVEDSFKPEQNINGGTAYLDRLLTRYRDNIALALAAYNAGPGAVDKYHGVPPFRETQAYVARVIREFNRRKRLLAVAAVLPPAGSLQSAGVKKLP